jgi:NADPH:quinone reductase-like Zn-dependent oxidoreductase
LRLTILQTGGRGVDHVIEVGGAATLAKSIASVRMAGYIHLVGAVAGGGDSDLSAIIGSVIGTAAILRGVFTGSARQFNDMNRLISVNKIQPVIDRVFEFEEAEQAYKYLESQQHVGKVVIRVCRD